MTLFSITPSGRIEFVLDGGMFRAMQIPYLGDEAMPEVKDRYFDIYTTYAPFEWLGSRRMTEKELKAWDEWNAEKGEA